MLLAEMGSKNPVSDSAREVLKGGPLLFVFHSFPLLILFTSQSLPPMDTTDIYAIAAGGILLFLILARVLLYLSRLITVVSIFVLKHFIYLYFINCHCLLKPWTRFYVLSHLLYVAVNVFCLCFLKFLASDAGRRAGVLSLVNMIPLFARVHLSFIADLLGISLSKFRGLHRAAG
jgi:hypothetical protein